MEKGSEVESAKVVHGRVKAFEVAENWRQNVSFRESFYKKNVPIGEICRNVLFYG